jgi:hypothetical protein
MHMTITEAPNQIAGATAIELVPRPSGLFLSASGRACGTHATCPAPTPRPCRGEAGLALAPHAPRGRGRNRAVGALVEIEAIATFRAQKE